MSSGELIADGNTPQKIAKRARIMLMTVDGYGTMAIMRAVGVAKTTVWRWREYFVAAGVAGLVKGRSRLPGRKPIPDDLKLTVVEKTLKGRPTNATHRSARTMASAWIELRNENPKPFVWTAKARTVIATYRRARSTLANATGRHL